MIIRLLLLLLQAVAPAVTEVGEGVLVSDYFGARICVVVAVIIVVAVVLPHFRVKRRQT